MATVELAAAMPVLLLLLGVGLGALDVARARIACVDAAREGARMAARAGEQTGREWAQRSAPAGSQVTIERADDAVTVTVSSTRRVMGVRAAAITVSGSATAAVEPDASEDGAATGPVFNVREVPSRGGMTRAWLSRAASPCSDRGPP